MEIQNDPPVLILPSISNIFEKAMYQIIVDHLEIYNLFYKEQHAFPIPPPWVP